jgi:hypothetical protein
MVSASLHRQSCRAIVLALLSLQACSKSAEREHLIGADPFAPPLLEGIKLGTDPESVAQLRSFDTRPLKGCFEEHSGKFGGVDATFEFTGNAVRAIALRGRKRAVRKGLLERAQKLWGPPNLTRGESQLVWNDVANRRRVSLRTDSVSFEMILEHYLLFEDLANKGGTAYFPAPKNVLGRSPSELVEAFPAIFCVEDLSPKAVGNPAEAMAEDIKSLKTEMQRLGIIPVSSYVPPTEAGPIRVGLRFDEAGRVAMMDVSIDNGYPQAREALNNAWGPGPKLGMWLDKTN